MSEKVKHGLNEFFVWATRALLAANIWFLSQSYYDFKKLKDDVQVIKEKVSALESTMDLIKNFDIVPKR